MSQTLQSPLQLSLFLVLPTRERFVGNLSTLGELAFSKLALLFKMRRRFGASYSRIILLGVNTSTS